VKLIYLKIVINRILRLNFLFCKYQEAEKTCFQMSFLAQIKFYFNSRVEANVKAFLTFLKRKTLLINFDEMFENTENY